MTQGTEVDLMPNPVSDFLDFLIGNTDDHNALGSWKYLFVVLFVALVVASIIVAWKNWREDPSQRTGRHLVMWFLRALVGGMWFQGMLWKLPLPVSGGCNTGSSRWGSGPRSAFRRHRSADPFSHALHFTMTLPNMPFS
jgi:hypothetical protein